MKIKATLKLILPGGKVNTGPPVGTILGQYGLDIKKFCTDFNQKTLFNEGQNLQVTVIVYTNRSYKFFVKTESTASLLLSAASLGKGSAKGSKNFLASISLTQLETIAFIKQTDFNTTNFEKALKSLKGTAIQMGITILDPLLEKGN